MTDHATILYGRPSWAADVVALISVLEGLGELPYDPTPSHLYRPDDLYRGFHADPGGGFAATVDQVIYTRARRSGQGPVAPLEALAQRLHDHGITVALDEHRAGRRLAGVMGGHALRRGADGYRQAVELGRAIAATGRCTVTGGGPGAMEAANFGARSSTVDETTVDALIAALARHPDFGHGDPAIADEFIAASLEVAASLPNEAPSLSVPTWFYGHEPSNPFATAIAKYFSNSEREDGLLAIATAGIVFLAGGPGTFQEVFQDAAQNAYRTFGHPSPMVFLDPPGDAGYWRRSGVLLALDTAFTTPDGGRRPGWDLVTVAGSVDEAVAALA